MVFPFAANFHLSLKNHHPIIGVAIILGILIPCVATLSFNITDFSPNRRDLNYDGSATPQTDSIQLTTNRQDVSSSDAFGRVTYAEPLYLWDKESGNLTDFTTHFSYVINSLNKTIYGDGFTFFLAPNGSLLDNVTGASLGLTSEDQVFNSTRNPFVAVEFDIYENEWDPFAGDYTGKRHVGIDINSMRSVATKEWRNMDNIMAGKLNDAWITYESDTKNLSVVFTSSVQNRTVVATLSHTVDLRENLTEWVTIGFSASTGWASAVFSIYSWSFSSNLQFNPPTKNIGPPTSVVDPPIIDPPTGVKSKIGLVIGVIVAVSVFVGGSAFLFCKFRKRRSRREYEDDTMINQISEFERGNGPKKFSYAELARATHNFAENGKLGEGGFGGVYKAYMTELNTYVAVKRVSKESRQGKKEYAAEVTIISRLSHINLVKLLGWCHEKGELLLVYQFMHNGSLDSHLFKRKSLLTWEMRYKIAKGIAAALLYLHEEWEQCVLHRDIKSSNVMLDLDFNAKLGDFGLARLVDHEKGSQTTLVAGTMGYMAPEIYIAGKASKETDIYSFGVVALEIACGRKPINFKAQEGEVNLVEWVWSLYGTDKLLDAVDSQISSNFNAQEIKHLMIVGLWCAHPDSNSRPSIRDAIRVLNFEASPPVLPSRLPMPTYATPIMNMPSSSTASSNGTHVSTSSQQSLLSNTDSSKFNSSSGPSSFD